MTKRIDFTQKQGIMTLVLTLGCNSRCRHCGVEAGYEKLHLRLTPEEIIAAIRTAKNNNIVAIELWGGEPFLALDLVELSLKEAEQAGFYSLIDTNASWAKTPEIARDILTPLVALGLRQIRISHDHYHAEFIPPNRVINACEQAARLGCRVQVVITEANDRLKLQTLGNLGSLKGFATGEVLTLHNLLPPMPIGRAASLSADQITFDGVAPVHCAHFEHHEFIVSVFPNQLVTLDCKWANPRLTYRYPLKENWLADMLEVWNKDQCIRDMWHKGLAEIIQLDLLSEQPCGYCFELLPRLYPDKELIDIRALQLQGGKT